MVGVGRPMAGLRRSASPKAPSCPASKAHAQGRKCDFRESVIILTSNLGAGQVRRKMGPGMEQDGGGQDARATVEKTEEGKTEDRRLEKAKKRTSNIEH